MRLSNERCLEIVKRGVRDVLMREVKSDAARDAGSVILRTLDELLMRDQGQTGKLNDALEIAIDEVRELLRQAEPFGDSHAECLSRFNRLVRHAQEWRSAPTFTDVHRELLGLSEDLLRLVLRPADAARTAMAMRIAQGAADMEDGFEQAMLAAAVLPEETCNTDRAVTPDELRALLSKETGDSELVISGFEQIPGGMSKRTYRFTADSKKAGRQKLIARETAGVPHGDFDCWLLSSEFQLVRDLNGLEFPVPDTLCLDPHDRFYIMRQSPGGRNASVFAVDTPIPKCVLLDMASFLGRLHSVEPKHLINFVKASDNEIVLGETMEQCVRRMLLKWRDYSNRMQRLPSPIEYGTFGWLWQNIPPNSDHPSILHGDFGPHNCLWEADGLTAVLDWEGGHFGDPAFDLGYCRPHFEKRMDWNEFLAVYEAAGGPHITPSRLEFFERFAMYRTLITDNQCVARGEAGEKSDLFVLQVDYEYWPGFIRQTAESSISEGTK